MASEEPLKFADCFADISRGVSKIKQKDYLPQGDHPIIDQGKELIAGYGCGEDGLCTDVPAIVFGDHTRCVKYVTEPFFAGADGVKILKPKDNRNPRYWFHCLRSKHIESLGYSRHFKLLKECTFIKHSCAEQESIATRLDRVLELIDEEILVLDMLDELVKSRFIEMFGDPVDNPYCWPKSRLPELGDLKNGVNFKSTDSGYEIRCLGVGDFKNRSKIDDIELIPKLQLNCEPSGPQILQDGDIVFVRSNGNKRLVGRCLAVFPGAEKVTFSGFCIRFRPVSEALILDYLLGVLKTDSMRQAMVGRGANIQNLSQKILSGIEIPIPPMELQQQFADFAAQVDKLKADSRQAIDKLQLLYDSLAQEYFGD